MKLDWSLLGGLVFISLLSLLSLASVNRELFWFQFGWYGFVFVLILLISRLDWRWLASHPLPGQIFYLFVAAALLLTLVLAEPIRGVKGWLVVGPLRLQFSELAKTALILVYAGFFAKRHLEISLLGNIFNSFLYFVAPAFLILRQPDLGAVLILFSIWAGFLLVNGLRLKRLFVGAVILVIVIAVLWTTVLKPYQKERIIGFVFPAFDPLGINYNVSQSKIAIGSGGFLGKGFGQGTQSHLGFLPEAATDFLFAAFVEEWGFVGGFALIAAFIFVAGRIAVIGKAASGNYGKFVCLGTIIVMGTQFFFNVGSNLGFSPVVGVTFPFFSYGGSSLLTLSILLGIIQNIARESSF